MDLSVSQSAWKKLVKQRWASVQMQRSEDEVGRVYTVIDGVSPDPYPKAHTRRANVWDVSALEVKECLPSTCGSVWVLNGVEDAYHTVGVFSLILLTLLSHRQSYLTSYLGSSLSCWDDTQI